MSETAQVRLKVARAQPVEVVVFTTTFDGRAVVLDWTTASELNNAGFEIQHRANTTAVETRHGASLQDGATWQPLAFVKGHGTTSEPRSYRYRVTDGTLGLHSGSSNSTMTAR